jgi:hypothetical protein
MVAFVRGRKEVFALPYTIVTETRRSVQVSRSNTRGGKNKSAVPLFFQNTVFRWDKERGLSDTAIDSDPVPMMEVVTSIRPIPLFRMTGKGNGVMSLGVTPTPDTKFPLTTWTRRQNEEARTKKYHGYLHPDRVTTSNDRRYRTVNARRPQQSTQPTGRRPPPTATATKTTNHQRSS